MPSINVDAVPPRLQTAVARDGNGLRVVRTLAPADIDRITAVARGDQRRAPALTRHRAIGVLADAVPPQVAVPLLSGIARDNAASRSTRIAAVAALGQIAAGDAQAALVTMLGSGDAHLEQATIKALGQIADASVLPVLERPAAPADPAVQRQLRFTRALIAHRNGLGAPFLEQVPRNPRPPGENEATRSVRLEVRSAEETNADLTRFQGPDYGLRFAARAYRLHCGRADWSLFVNGDLGSLTAADRLRARPWIAGILSRWMPPDIANATQYLLLTRPVGGSVHVDVVRTDGEIVYTGTIAAAGTGVSFDISDVERQQTAPTRLEGSLTGDGVRFDVARVAQTRVAQRRTQPARPTP